MVLRRCVRYAREPGGICVSGKVYEEISGRFDLAFQDMGEQQLKNIARNVRVYRVRLDNVAPTPLPQLALPDKPSILPFQEHERRRQARLLRPMAS